MDPENEGQGFDSGESQGTENQSTGNPAWGDILSAVPEDLHSQLTPQLEKWDQGVQQGYQKVHEQYAPYKPFLDSGIGPEDINFSLGLMDAIQNRPEEVLAALQEFTGSSNQGQQQTTEQTGSQGQENNQQTDLTQHPEFKRLQEQNQQIAQVLLDRQMKEQQQAEDAKLQSDIEALKEKVGPFDEKYAIGLCIADPKLSLEDAAKQYQALEQSILSNQRRPAPKVLGSGGNIPNSQQVDPTKMDSKDTKSYIASMLEAAKNSQ